MKTDRLRLALLEDPSLLASLKAWLEDETDILRRKYKNQVGEALIQHQGREKQMDHLNTALDLLLKRRSSN